MNSRKSFTASFSAFKLYKFINLEKWLTSTFFKRYISQFKKRPIAWQIELNSKGSRTQGFCPEDNQPLKTRIRQLAIEDATLCLKTRWLGKLATTLQPQLTIWKQTATETQLHPRFPHLSRVGI